MLACALNFFKSDIFYFELFALGFNKTFFSYRCDRIGLLYRQNDLSKTKIALLSKFDCQIIQNAQGI